MKLALSGLLGLAFGFVLFVGEVISWDRVNEMFSFTSFHMYGVIGSAIVTGLALRLIASSIGLKTIDSLPFPKFEKKNGFISLFFGGVVFGLGWACTGACPGPIFIHLGAGNGIFAFVLIMALLGTIVYGLLKEKLPH
ncbi:MAG TPA: transporter [Flavobacteriales bacterium]|nr:transporter [Crocinitomicaceae bacterium]HAE31589.1 transporter [Flavobacteriales bacterium]|tara:strand:+ start:2124 stop:2537 length:414 start_codon:yes stop_codon:yes gene_type:complete